MTSSDRDLLVRLWGDLDVTQVEMAQRLQKSVETVRKIAKEIGLPRRQSKLVNGILQASIALRQELTPWPDNITFTDHPQALSEPFCWANAMRNGSRFIASNVNAQSSMGDRQC